MRHVVLIVVMLLPAIGQAAPRPKTAQRQTTASVRALRSVRTLSSCSPTTRDGAAFPWPCTPTCRLRKGTFSTRRRWKSWRRRECDSPRPMPPLPFVRPRESVCKRARARLNCIGPKRPPPEQGRKLIEPQIIKSISADQTTYAELLRKAGYATAHFGKWHISGGGPGEHGYDEHDGDTGNENAYQFTDPNPVDIFGMAERASAFMEKNSKAKRPFFIQLSWNALHALRMPTRPRWPSMRIFPTSEIPSKRPPRRSPRTSTPASAWCCRPSIGLDWPITPTSFTRPTTEPAAPDAAACAAARGACGKGASACR